MNLLIVVGARPNFMKVAPLIEAIKRHNQSIRSSSANGQPARGETVRQILVHTGQHYDDLMSGAFFRDLNLPKPDVHLGVGSGSHAVQTAEIMKKFEEVLIREKPDIVAVVGDVNSTLACALVTAKVSFDSAGSRPLVAHVEAGLRSFDRSMPEEVNRVLTDHLSDLLFVTEESGVRNLRNEGVPPENIHFVGNTMIDALLALLGKAETSTILHDLELCPKDGNAQTARSVDRYALLTLHRPGNVDDRDSFMNILNGLEELAREYPVVFPVHPRTRQRIKEFGLDRHFSADASQAGKDRGGSGNGKRGIVLIDPLGYLDFLCLMKYAALVVTDSGGIQEETTILGTPCVTVRENTERPVTVESGTNAIAGTGTSAIKDTIRHQLGGHKRVHVPRNWDGQAAARIISILVQKRGERKSVRTSFVPNTLPVEDRCLRP